jgi:hypothetical protein
LRIELHESSDEESDRERLMGILSALPDHPGADIVRLFIHTHAGDEVEMELPNAGISDALLTRLRTVLGRAGSVTVEPLAGATPLAP